MSFYIFQSLCGNPEQTLILTPLQKARRALRLALKKAAQDLFMQHSPNQLSNLNFGCNGNKNIFSVLIYLEKYEILCKTYFIT